MTIRFALTFILGTALLLIGGLFHAHGKDAYRVVPIYAYCHSPEPFTDAISLSKTEGHPSAISHLDESVSSGECRSGQFFFLAQGIERDIEDGAEGHEMVLRGMLSTGKTVYIWINEPEYKLFLVEGNDV